MGAPVKARAERRLLPHRAAGELQALCASRGVQPDVSDLVQAVGQHVLNESTQPCDGGQTGDAAVLGAERHGSVRDRKQAAVGDADAMGAIAAIYQRGQLAPQNPREAILWYELASRAVASGKKGRVASANFADVLGDIYYNGTGVDQDKVQAFEWYAIACTDATRLKIPGDSSCASRNQLGNELTPVEVAKAQALAAEWQKLHR